MANKAQLDRIAARIEALAGRLNLSEPPPERWIVDGDRAYQRGDPDRVSDSSVLASNPGCYSQDGKRSGTAKSVAATERLPLVGVEQTSFACGHEVCF
jgi:hypothetical protein